MVTSAPGGFDSTMAVPGGGAPGALVAASSAGGATTAVAAGSPGHGPAGLAATGSKLGERPPHGDRDGQGRRPASPEALIRAERRHEPHDVGCRVRGRRTRSGTRQKSVVCLSALIPTLRSGTEACAAVGGRVRVIRPGREEYRFRHRQAVEGPSSSRKRRPSLPQKSPRAAPDQGCTGVTFQTCRA
jgi:hypothetical protein